MEIGPSLTLTGTATRTLKEKYEVRDDSASHRRVIACHAKYTEEVYCQFEEEAEAPTPAAAAPAPVAVATAPAAPSNAATSIQDVPLKATKVLVAIMAQKLKKEVEQVPLSKSIKDLVGIKSTMPSELLGDLQLEFSSAPEKGEELLLEELGSSLGVGFSGSLGKYTSCLISCLVSSKLPSGFNLSAIKSYLSNTWGIGSSRADGVLIFGATMDFAKRLGSEGEAKAWLDNVVAVYAQRSAISLVSGGAAGGAAAGGGVVINSLEEFLQFAAGQDRFASQQVGLRMRSLGHDSRAGEIKYDAENASAVQIQARLDAIVCDHGDVYIDGIQPIFHSLKARHFDSYSNWVRQDALFTFYDIIVGRLTTVGRDITTRCTAIMNRAHPDLLAYIQYCNDRCDPERGETYKLAKRFGQQLIDNYHLREPSSVP